jgi:lysozyme family protein
MNVQIPLDTMTVKEKLRAMEEIWADLRRQPETVPSPNWHRGVLDAKEQNDALSYEDWKIAKDRIRTKTR